MHLIVTITSDVHEAVSLRMRRGRGRKLEAEARTRQPKNCVEVPQGKAIASRNTSLTITNGAVQT